MSRKALAARNLVSQQVRQTLVKTDFTWRYVGNLRPALKYRARRPELSGAALKALGDLRRDGVAITSVQEFSGAATLFEELQSAVKQRAKVDAAKLEATRAGNDDPQAKSYLFKLLGSRPPMDPQSIFARMSLQPEILNVASAYFEMYVKLRHFNVWYNFPTSAEARESQLWHRDPEDRQILKVFVYLSDVKEGAGALTYAPGTHAMGHVKTQPKYRLVREGPVNVRRSDDEQIAAVVPEEKWVLATGAPGTIVFADTRGFHKGGLVRQGERVVYVSMFTSGASLLPDRLLDYDVPDATVPDGAVSYAIRA